MFGREPEDMAVAAKALIACGGGMAVASGGRLRALVELPVCGLLSEQPTLEVAKKLATLREAADAVVGFSGSSLAFTAIVGASLACNRGPHVTDLGVTDGANGVVFETSIIAFEPLEPAPA